jgi:ABC-2 type transport system permease protein
MATTNYWLNINIFELIILIILGIFSILGIGLIFGGLALIFKKIQSLLNIVQYFLIGIVITGAREFESVLTWIMPFRAATEGIYRITIGGDSILNFSVIDISKIIVNSAVYFIVGLFIFNQCSLIAKKRGLLGQY